MQVTFWGVRGSVAVPAGASVGVCLGAANHDPARFDRPHEFDILRGPVNHLHRPIGLADTTSGH